MKRIIQRVFVIFSLTFLVGCTPVQPVTSTVEAGTTASIPVSFSSEREEVVPSCKYTWQGTLFIPLNKEECEKGEKTNLKVPLRGGWYVFRNGGGCSLLRENNLPVQSGANFNLASESTLQLSCPLGKVAEIDFLRENAEEKK